MPTWVGQSSRGRTKHSEDYLASPKTPFWGLPLLPTFTKFAWQRQAGPYDGLDVGLAFKTNVQCPTDPHCKSVGPISIVHVNFWKQVSDGNRITDGQSGRRPDGNHIMRRETLDPSFGGTGAFLCRLFSAKLGPLFTSKYSLQGLNPWHKASRILE